MRVGWRHRGYASLLLCTLALAGCHSTKPTIAVIPRTSGTLLWEPEHGGALAAALPLGAQIYWNAPTREDDIQGQIALVEHVCSGGFQGMILAPDHALALITPVRRALKLSIPTIILGTPLVIPEDANLGFVLNDETAGGRMAADRMATILNGRGSIAVFGIDPDISGIMTRTHSLEQHLAERYPDIRIVANQPGSFNAPHEQQVAEETLKNYPNLDGIVAMTSTSMRGAMAALESSHTSGVTIIGFDPDLATFDSPGLDSFVIEDTHGMGAAAVQMIVAKLRGKPMPGPVMFQPVLVTRSNLNDPEVQRMLSMDWHPASMRWKWSVGP